jgi:hypothetical protein
VPDGELADRALAGEVPVDRAARPAHQLLQLGEQRHLAQEVLGRATAGHPAEEGTETEGITRGVTPAAGLPALGVTVGQPEAERHVTHASTVDV